MEKPGRNFLHAARAALKLRESAAGTVRISCTPRGLPALLRTRTVTFYRLSAGNQREAFVNRYAQVIEYTGL